MAIDYAQEALKKMANLTSDQSIEDKKKKAREEVMRLANSQRKTAQQEAAKAGVGSGISRLAGTRIRETAAEAGGRAAIEAGQQAEQQQMQGLGQMGQLGLGSQQTQLASQRLGMDQAQQDWNMQMGEKDYGLRVDGMKLENKKLALQKQAFNAEQANILWNQGFQQEQADTAAAQFTAQLDQDMAKFEMGQLSAEEAQAKLMDHQKNMAALNNVYEAGLLEVKARMERDSNRSQYAFLKAQQDTLLAHQAKLAQWEIDSKKKSWWEKLTGAVGDIGGAVKGVASLGI